MRALGEWSIASFIRFVLDAAWWLGAVAMALFIGIIALRLSTSKLEGTKLTMDLPVAIELAAPVHASSGSIESDARVEKLRGNIKFPVRADAFFVGNIMIAVLLLGILLWTIAQLRHIFRSLSRGLLFVPDNAKRIRWVGFAVICGELARAGLVYFWSYYTSVRFTANGYRFIAATDFSGITILSGLAILVIAEVFREGIRLHEEQSLTI